MNHKNVYNYDSSFAVITGRNLVVNNGSDPRDYFEVDYNGNANIVVDSTVNKSGCILPTISSTDLTPGSSALASGQVYFKYD